MVESVKVVKRDPSCDPMPTPPTKKRKKSKKVKGKGRGTCCPRKGFMLKGFKKLLSSVVDMIVKSSKANSRFNDKEVVRMHGHLNGDPG